MDDTALVNDSSLIKGEVSRTLRNVSILSYFNLFIGVGIQSLVSPLSTLYGSICFRVFMDLVLVELLNLLRTSLHSGIRNSPCSYLLLIRTLGYTSNCNKSLSPE